ncbi:MAG: hypothetical protein HN580_21045 [Deltaproteobacteria bacterium]|jgi:hypothetical protein|nr:hypothetical protein [Deltaproteobacteria bacterium]MBT4090290.1 hypothetical protein [Deltaproteobacteria bacterium]MBT4266223.1 hypothetical protein [Deltaproteobacteria bacterium]MBT4637386.1 hypothetical protein [Deltaproteobacteria bacterium]MBT6499421.1 hypothetical protein [Deltaproteobacteria bacterium]
MKELEKPKSLRIRGAELIVTGGVTLFFSKFMLWLGPFALCGFGLYRWLIRKSYKEGIISLAVGILLLFLLNGPFSFIAYLLYGTGGFLVALGAVFMLLPGKKMEKS